MAFFFFRLKLTFKNASVKNWRVVQTRPWVFTRAPGLRQALAMEKLILLNATCSFTSFLKNLFFPASSVRGRLQEIRPQMIPADQSVHRGGGASRTSPPSTFKENDQTQRCLPAGVCVLRELEGPAGVQLTLRVAAVTWHSRRNMGGGIDELCGARLTVGRPLQRPGALTEREQCHPVVWEWNSAVCL